MMLALIALRNLSRNRRRTLLSLLVISVGAAGLLLTLGFVRYSFAGLRDALIQGGLGHLEIVPRAEAEGAASPMDRSGVPPLLAEWRRLRDLVEARPGVRAAAAAVQFAGVATNGERSAAVLGVAVEPDRQRRMGMTVKLRGGSVLPDEAPLPGEDRVMLGLGLAHVLGATPGDLIVVMSSTASGTLNAVDLTVAGILTSGFQDLDARLLQVHVATAERLLATDNVSSLVVSLTDSATIAAAAEDLRALTSGHSPPLAVVDWETRAPFYHQVRGLYTGVFVFLGTIIAVLVALSISNTLLMSVLERVREFGTLLAIGTSRAQLAALMVLEAMWLALLGSLAGSVITLLLAALINALQIEMPPPPAAVDPITLALLLRAPDFFWTALFMAALLAVAAVPPMLRVMRLKVVDALGHV